MYGGATHNLHIYSSTILLLGATAESGAAPAYTYILHNTILQPPNLHTLEGGGGSKLILCLFEVKSK